MLKCSNLLLRSYSPQKMEFQRCEIRQNSYETPSFTLFFKPIYRQRINPPPSTEFDRPISAVNPFNRTGNLPQVLQDFPCPLILGNSPIAPRNWNCQPPRYIPKHPNWRIKQEPSAKLNKNRERLTPENAHFLILTPKKNLL